MEFIYDIYGTVIEAAKLIKPDAKAIIQWDPELRIRKHEYGCTLFPADGGTPVISLNPKLIVERSIDILAHELAHVIAGADADHGPEWAAAYNQIHANVEKLVSIKE